MQGYWNDPEETTRRYRPGRYPAERLLYTGDLFYMDEDGFLYFVARKDDIIKTRGEKVAPREVEEVLCKLPGVVEAAVVGVPDEVLGQAIKAVIVCGDGVRLTRRDVLRHCKSIWRTSPSPATWSSGRASPKPRRGRLTGVHCVHKRARHF